MNLASRLVKLFGNPFALDLGEGQADPRRERASATQEAGMSASDSVARCSDAHLDDWGPRRRPVLDDESGATWVVDGSGSRTLIQPEPGVAGMWRLSGLPRLTTDQERHLRTMEALRYGVQNPQPVRKYGRRR